MANQPTKYKKFLAGAASATLVATAIVPTALAAEVEKAATDFSDVAATHTHYAAIMQAVERELFNGYGDGTFKPENSIERKGVTKALANYVVAQSDYKTYEEYITANKLVEKVTPFTDVPATHGDSELFNASLIVKDAGIFSGSNNNLMPAKNISRQQMAKVLVNGFGLKDLAGVESEVTDTDKAQAEYVNFINILSENDVTEVTTYNPTGDVKRGQMASFLNRAFDAAHKVVAPETATKVVSVSATNLKEIVVAFDGSVDAATATDADNYSTTAPGGVASAELSEDGKSVTLTLGKDGNGVEQSMKNQTKYKVSVSNVKAGDKEVEVKDFEFMPLDNTLPEANSVTALGNKAVKIVMSEPIKNAKASNFKLDDKSFYGSVTVTGNEIVLKPYDASVLTIGEHKVTVSLVEDYNTLKSLQTDHNVTVVEDKEGPTVTNVEATLERVVLTFNEDIDPATVSSSDVYWMTGGNKKTAVDFTRLAGNKYAFDFTGKALPGYETTLYVDSVNDWSGNANATKEVKVTATVDQTRPEVVLAEADTDSPRKIRVKFSKPVKLSTGTADKKYFTILNKDGKVIAVKDVTKIDAKTFDVTLFGDLSTGNNTLKISGVKDTTVLENTMLDYTTTLTLGDITPPTVSGVSGKGTTIVVTFNEKMDLSTISNAGNYLINFKPDGASAASLRALPSDSEITPIQDGKAVLIELPEEIGTTDVVLGSSTSVQGIQVMNAKDLAGNTLYTSSIQPISTDLAKVKDYPTYGTNEAVLVDKRTIKVNFDQPIGEADLNDFTLTNSNGADIERVEANGTSVVTITTDDDLQTDTSFVLQVSTTNDMKTVAGNDVLGSATAVNVYDEVAPEVAEDTSTTDNVEIDAAGKVIKVTFTEALNEVPEALYAGDVSVNVLGEGVLNAQSEYKTTVGTGADANKLIITLTDALVADSTVAVTVDSDLDYIQDKTGNKAVGGDTLEVGFDYTAPVADATAPATVALAAGSTAPVGGVTNVAIPAAGTTDTTGAVTGWVATTADEVKFTVTDSGSAASTITINGVAYTSGTDYTIAAATPLTVVVTTTEAGKTTVVRTFTVAVSA